MTDLQLYKEIESLPEDLKKRVSDFVKNLKLQVKSKPKTEPVKKRKAGLAKGFIIMSDDFDEPLEEFKDYM